MARRATGGRTIRVTGVHTALRAHLVAFATHWQAEQTWREVDALDAYDLAVPGELIWRATYDPLYPDVAEPFLGDPHLYLITGPDTVETVPNSH